MKFTTPFLRMLVVVISMTATSICWSQQGSSNRDPEAEERAKNEVAYWTNAVENAPNDREAHRSLIEAGLSLFTKPGYDIPDSARPDILLLKLVMDDIRSLEATVEGMGPPWPPARGMTATALLSRLQVAKVPPGRRRSVPLIDPWGTPYRLFVDSPTGNYKIVCAGRDGVFDPENLTFSDEDRDLRVHPVRRSSTLDDDIVFVSGANFTHIFDYPHDAVGFLYTPCEPADEAALRRVRCW